MPNNLKYHLCMGCQVDTHSHSIAPSFILDAKSKPLQSNMSSSLQVRICMGVVDEYLANEREVGR